MITFFPVRASSLFLLAFVLISLLFPLLVVSTQETEVGGVAAPSAVFSFVERSGVLQHPHFGDFPREGDATAAEEREPERARVDAKEPRNPHRGAAAPPQNGSDKRESTTRGDERGKEDIYEAEDSSADGSVTADHGGKEDRSERNEHSLGARRLVGESDEEAGAEKGGDEEAEGRAAPAKRGEGRGTKASTDEESPGRPHTTEGDDEAREGRASRILARAQMNSTRKGRGEQENAVSTGALGASADEEPPARRRRKGESARASAPDAAPEILTAPASFFFPSLASSSPAVDAFSDSSAPLAAHQEGHEGPGWHTDERPAARATGEEADGKRKKKEGRGRPREGEAQSADSGRGDAERRKTEEEMRRIDEERRRIDEEIRADEWRRASWERQRDAAHASLSSLSSAESSGLNASSLSPPSFFSLESAESSSDPSTSLSLPSLLSSVSSPSLSAPSAPSTPVAPSSSLAAPSPSIVYSPSFSSRPSSPPFPPHAPAALETPPLVSPVLPPFFSLDSFLPSPALLASSVHPSLSYSPFPASSAASLSASDSASFSPEVWAAPVSSLLSPVWGGAGEALGSTLVALGNFEDPLQGERQAQGPDREAVRAKPEGATTESEGRPPTPRRLPFRVDDERKRGGGAPRKRTDADRSEAHAAPGADALQESSEAALRLAGPRERREDAVLEPTGLLPPQELKSVRRPKKAEVVRASGREGRDATQKLTRGEDARQGETQTRPTREETDTLFSAEAAEKQGRGDGGREEEKPRPLLESSAQPAERRSDSGENAAYDHHGERLAFLPLNPSDRPQDEKQKRESDGGGSLRDARKTAADSGREGARRDAAELSPYEAEDSGNVSSASGAEPQPEGAPSEAETNTREEIRRREGDETPDSGRGGPGVLSALTRREELSTAVIRAGGGEAELQPEARGAAERNSAGRGDADHLKGGAEEDEEELREDGDAGGRGADIQGEADHEATAETPEGVLPLRARGHGKSPLIPWSGGKAEEEVEGRRREGRQSETEKEKKEEEEKRDDAKKDRSGARRSSDEAPRERKRQAEAADEEARDAEKEGESLTAEAGSRKPEDTTTQTKADRGSGVLPGTDEKKENPTTITWAGGRGVAAQPRAGEEKQEDARMKETKEESREEKREGAKRKKDERAESENETAKSNLEEGESAENDEHTEGEGDENQAKKDSKEGEETQADDEGARNKEENGDREKHKTEEDGAAEKTEEDRKKDEPDQSGSAGERAAKEGEQDTKKTKDEGSAEKEKKDAQDESAADKEDEASLKAGDPQESTKNSDEDEEATKAKDDGGMEKKDKPDKSDGSKTAEEERNANGERSEEKEEDEEETETKEKTPSISEKRKKNRGDGKTAEDEGVSEEDSEANEARDGSVAKNKPKDDEIPREAEKKKTAHARDAAKSAEDDSVSTTGDEARGGADDSQKKDARSSSADRGKRASTSASRSRTPGSAGKKDEPRPGAAYTPDGIKVSPKFAIEAIEDEEDLMVLATMIKENPLLQGDTLLKHVAMTIFAPVDSAMGNPYIDFDKLRRLHWVNSRGVHPSLFACGVFAAVFGVRATSAGALPAALRGTHPACAHMLAAAHKHTLTRGARRALTARWWKPHAATHSVSSCLGFQKSAIPNPEKTEETMVFMHVVAPRIIDPSRISEVPQTFEAKNKQLLTLYRLPKPSTTATSTAVTSTTSRTSSSSRNSTSSSSSPPPGSSASAAARRRSEPPEGAAGDEGEGGKLDGKDGGSGDDRAGARSPSSSSRGRERERHSAAASASAEEEDADKKRSPSASASRPEASVSSGPGSGGNEGGRGRETNSASDGAFNRGRARGRRDAAASGASSRRLAEWDCGDSSCTLAAASPSLASHSQYSSPDSALSSAAFAVPADAPSFDSPFSSSAPASLFPPSSDLEYAPARGFGDATHLGYEAAEPTFWPSSPQPPDAHAPRSSAASFFLPGAAAPLSLLSPRPARSSLSPTAVDSSSTFTSAYSAPSASLHSPFESLHAPAPRVGMLHSPGRDSLGDSFGDPWSLEGWQALSEPHTHFSHPAQRLPQSTAVFSAHVQPPSAAPPAESNRTAVASPAEAPRESAFEDMRVMAHGRIARVVGIVKTKRGFIYKINKFLAPRWSPGPNIVDFIRTRDRFSKSNYFLAATPPELVEELKLAGPVTLFLVPDSGWVFPNGEIVPYCVFRSLALPSNRVYVQEIISWFAVPGIWNKTMIQRADWLPTLGDGPNLAVAHVNGRGDRIRPVRLRAASSPPPADVPKTPDDLERAAALDALRVARAAEEKIQEALHGGGDAGSQGAGEKKAAAAHARRRERGDAPDSRRREGDSEAETAPEDARKTEANAKKAEKDEEEEGNTKEDNRKEDSEKKESEKKGSEKKGSEKKESEKKEGEKKESDREEEREDKNNRASTTTSTRRTTQRSTRAPRSSAFSAFSSSSTSLSSPSSASTSSASTSSPSASSTSSSSLSSSSSTSDSSSSTFSSPLSSSTASLASASTGSAASSPSSTSSPAPSRSLTDFLADSWHTTLATARRLAAQPLLRLFEGRRDEQGELEDAPEGAAGDRGTGSALGGERKERSDTPSSASSRVGAQPRWPFAGGGRKLSSGVIDTANISEGDASEKKHANGESEQAPDEGGARSGRTEAGASDRAKLGRRGFLPVSSSLAPSGSSSSSLASPSSLFSQLSFSTHALAPSSSDPGPRRENASPVAFVSSLLSPASLSPAPSASAATGAEDSGGSRRGLLPAGGDTRNAQESDSKAGAEAAGNAKPRREGDGASRGAVADPPTANSPEADSWAAAANFVEDSNAGDAVATDAQEGMRKRPGRTTGRTRQERERSGNSHASARPRIEPKGDLQGEEEEGNAVDVDAEANSAATEGGDNEPLTRRGKIPAEAATSENPSREKRTGFLPPSASQASAPASSPLAAFTTTRPPSAASSGASSFAASPSSSASAATSAGATCSRRDEERGLCASAAEAGKRDGVLPTQRESPFPEKKPKEEKAEAEAKSDAKTALHGARGTAEAQYGGATSQESSERENEEENRDSGEEEDREKKTEEGAEPEKARPSADAKEERTESARLTEEERSRGEKKEEKKQGQPEREDKAEAEKAETENEKERGDVQAEKTETKEEATAKKRENAKSPVEEESSKQGEDKAAERKPDTEEEERITPRERNEEARKEAMQKGNEAKDAQAKTEGDAEAGEKEKKKAGRETESEEKEQKATAKRSDDTTSDGDRDKEGEKKRSEAKDTKDRGGDAEEKEEKKRDTAEKTKPETAKKEEKDLQDHASVASHAEAKDIPKEGTWVEPEDYYTFIEGREVIEWDIPVFNGVVHVLGESVLRPDIKTLATQLALWQCTHQFCFDCPRLGGFFLHYLDRKGLLTGPTPFDFEVPPSVRPEWVCRGSKGYFPPGWTKASWKAYVDAAASQPPPGSPKAAAAARNVQRLADEGARRAAENKRKIEERYAEIRRQAAEAYARYNPLEAVEEKVYLPGFYKMKKSYYDKHLYCKGDELERTVAEHFTERDLRFVLPWK
ncbi:hypothetical protein BESB_078140 [Besnoitia besnoiti]|uniref:Transmembrane protein n=1 Tax=Besnoitia besnoiti TaxID=94643 RepID=A0A2A9M533_BESBE|nr:hypothetical protein BESB_078140 [Besnoitia besnoiti]PFH33598.1 hypothetical protein BESB_078140 [Besnoitia besnoiti]